MTKQTFEYTQEMIDDVLDNFDFEKVKVVMDALDWGWRSEGVPDISDMRKEARRLLRDAIAENARHKEHIVTGTGGFEVECDGDGWLKLRFVVSDWEIGNDG